MYLFVNYTEVYFLYFFFKIGDFKFVYAELKKNYAPPLKCMKIHATICTRRYTVCRNTLYILLM